MATTALDPAEMYRALVARDPAYEGLFYVCVRTTGVFCRPTCPARKPRPENVEFCPSAQEALAAGFRPCRRCRPLEPAGAAPAWLRGLVDEIEREPARRWSDGDLRARGLDPGRVRRWFRTHHGMTFHAFQRARRIGSAHGRLARGATLDDAAEGHGYASLSGFRGAFTRVLQDAPGRARALRRAVTKTFPTPLGPMVACATDEGVGLLEFADRSALPRQLERFGRRLGCLTAPGEHALLERLERELAEYFAGRRRAFEVPLVLAGTPFQLAVWRALGAIPYGGTRSYDELARSLGRAGAQRAVGQANGSNPLAIVVPCHRVVRSDGSPGGYGGGLRRKEFLLALERGAACSLPASGGSR